MTSLRRFAYAVFGVACTHLVFGAIVRISGSGMGCGPHWPKCYGHWFPPMDRPDLVIEVTHRYLASILLLSLLALLAAAYRRRGESGVGGQGGVLRMAALATALGFGAALLGAVTVKLGNSAPATVAHWTVAMSLVAAVTATLIRAGGLGGSTARRGGASARTRRATFAAAGLALTAVVMGGLTAKVQGGPIACLAFPLCGANAAVPRGAVHVQSGHRVVAILLVLHLVGLFFALRKRREAALIRRAASIALGLGVLQLLVAGAMIGMHLPPVLRSLHEATGVSIWIATFTLAYLARLASDDRPAGQATGGAPQGPIAPVDLDPIDPRAAASVRTTVAARPVRASAVSAATPSAGTGAIAAAPAVRAELSASAVTVAPSHDAAGLVSAYLPVPALVTIVESTPDARREEAAAGRAAGEPVELTAALAHAGRIAAVASLAFHHASAGAASMAADGERRALATLALQFDAESGRIAAVVVAVPEVDDAAVVDVEMFEVAVDAGARDEPAPSAGAGEATVARGEPAASALVAESTTIETVVATRHVASPATAGSPELPATVVAAGDAVVGSMVPRGVEGVGADADACAVGAVAGTGVAGVGVAALAADGVGGDVAGEVEAGEVEAGEVEAGAPPECNDTMESPVVSHPAIADLAVSLPAGDAGILVAEMEGGAATIPGASAAVAVGAVSPDAEAGQVGARELSGTSFDVAVGPPPIGEDTWPTHQEPDDFGARVTIFDDVPAEPAADELYNLRELVRDDDGDGWDDVQPDRVPTLDEEFSAQAMAYESGDGALAVPVESSRPVALAAMTAAEGPVTTTGIRTVRVPGGSLTEISALRRPAMTHSVAVIVARGADF